jgi:hypothetical protein
MLVSRLCPLEQAILLALPAKSASDPISTLIVGFDTSPMPDDFWDCNARTIGRDLRRLMGQLMRNVEPVELLW